MAENEKNTEIKKASKENKPSFAQRLASVGKKIGTWFRSIKSECKKISWASWKSVRSNSLIVIVFVIILSAVLALLDYTFKGAISGLYKIFH